jgi:hypothetical protein
MKDDKSELRVHAVFGCPVCSAVESAMGTPQAAAFGLASARFPHLLCDPHFNMLERIRASLSDVMACGEGRAAELTGDVAPPKRVLQ